LGITIDVACIVHQTRACAIDSVAVVLVPAKLCAAIVKIPVIAEPRSLALLFSEALSPRIDSTFENGVLGYIAPFISFLA
jgi:hypothetical protein